MIQSSLGLLVQICRLCGLESELRNSHIVPEFLYGDLYNEKNQMMGIDGQSRRGWRILQNGIREKLFCEKCEQHFNEHFEKPFRAQWLVACPLLDPWTVSGIHWINVDYNSFKLFHLSVLFRASVSSLQMFADVSLGPHEERIRRLILDKHAGESWQYLVFGYAVTHHKTNRLIRMVSRAQKSKFGGRRRYGMMYGGVEWWVCVASDRNIEFEQLALQADGRMPFIALPWNEVGVVHDASLALNNARR